MKTFDKELILETINMIKLHNLDIRTVTMAISLRDCMDRDVNRVCDRIRKKIISHAKDLIRYANEIENDYSIPIVTAILLFTIGIE